MATLSPPLIPCNMSSISYDPSALYLGRIYNYFWVASYIAVVYDWALTFGQEVDLIWRQHWSIVTVLYLSLRYIGLVLSVLYTQYLLSVPFTNASCIIMYFIYSLEFFAANSIIGAITIIRLHAMYRNSRRMLILLILIYSLVTIACGVIIVKQSITFIALEELPNTCQAGNDPLLAVVTWILGTVWEVLALCLAVRIAIKDFRGLPTGWTIGDCLTTLIKSHVLYFASFTMVAALNFSMMSPNVNTATTGAYVYGGFMQICSLVQMFVLGPRLVLSIREYSAKLVANSDEVITITSIVFQEDTRVLADSDHDV